MEFPAALIDYYIMCIIRGVCDVLWLRPVLKVHGSVEQQTTQGPKWIIQISNLCMNVKSISENMEYHGDGFSAFLIRLFFRELA